MTGIGKIPRRASGDSAVAFTRTRHVARIKLLNASQCKSMQKVVLGAGDGVNVQQKSRQINCGESWAVTQLPLSTF
jgi:hypothetical protein